MSDYCRSPACPDCGSTQLISHGKRNALYPVGCCMVLGWYFSTIHKAASPMEYECAVCHRRFAKRTKGGLVALWIFVGLVLMLVAFSMWIVPYLRRAH